MIKSIRSKWGAAAKPAGLVVIGFLVVAVLPRSLLTSDKQAQAVPEIRSGIVVPTKDQSVPARLTIPKDKKQLTYRSPVFEADFGFNAVAPEWKQANTKNEESAQIFFRVSVDGQSWSDWLDVHPVTDQREDIEQSKSKLVNAFPEVPHVLEGKFLQYKVQLHRAGRQASPIVKNVTLTYLDSREVAEESWQEQLLPQASAKVQGEDVISRADWGSPDPYGNKFRNNPSKYWTPLHHDTTQVFIHHTVNSNNESNPAAAIRAIWYYHAITRGYGDIGYNYLVDNQGRVYEGRWGGENVRAGHTLHYNSGSIGVALLGCFDASSTCAYMNSGASNAPSKAMTNGLTDLLAWKLSANKVPPGGKHRFCGDAGCLRLDRITGHRSAYGTSCPGYYVASRLPTIRKQVAKKMRSRNYAYAAERLSLKPLYLGGANETKNFIIRFKNTGSKSWYRRAGLGQASLIVSNPTGRNTKFDNSEWESPSRAALLNQTIVRPGQIGSFTLPIKRSKTIDGSFFESFRLYISDRGPISNFYTFELSALPFSQLYSWNLQNLQVFSDDTKSVTVDTAELEEATPYYVSATVKNTGWAAWLSQNKTHRTVLSTIHPNDHASALCHASWTSCSRPTGFVSDIPSAGVTTIDFWIEPNVSGDFIERFTLVADDVYRFPADDFTISGTTSPGR